jgi:hypothetical protein
MGTEELFAAFRESVRKEAAAELMRLHDESGKAVRPGLWLAATTLDPSLRSFSDD